MEMALLSAAVTVPETDASWDRGFDTADIRIGGPVDHSYLFHRVR